MDLHLPSKSDMKHVTNLSLTLNKKPYLFLAFTATIMEEEKQKAHDCGCDGIISKPIDVSTFASTIKTFIKRDCTK